MMLIQAQDLLTINQNENKENKDLNRHRQRISHKVLLLNRSTLFIELIVGLPKDELWQKHYLKSEPAANANCH